MPPIAAAEYGDVLLNKHSEVGGVAPVVFPHWFHRIRFRCSVCHSELGFKMKVGSNDIHMIDMLDGKYCGHCHNGEIAWGLDNCHLCHTGETGMPSRIQRGHATKGPGAY